VHTLFTIISPTVKGHLSMLSSLSYALQSNDFKNAVLAKETREIILTEAAKIDTLLDKSNKDKSL